ncbi:hypothetical protein [Promineifilum sp.]|uniref:hypothetical protein n=1 Tax=Promineifilum sp. TaxID=2664178 RepID=UPI0035AE3685
MGPLVYYCRWRGAKVRLHGRDDAAVWGELVTQEEGRERVETFHFDLRTWELRLQAEGEATVLQLDELGVVVSGPATSF